VEEKIQRDRAEREENSAKARLYASQLALIQSYWNEGNAPAARATLDELAEHQDTWEYRYLYSMLHSRGQRSLLGHDGTVQSVAYSPNGKLLVSSSSDKTVRVWDLGTEREVLCIKPEKSVGPVAFLPDGQQFITAGDGVTVWDVRTGRAS
jgi:WD40 repeat protein